ncbi:hypothetical protein EIN_142000 [Entamoeba invadens IP1]|uniref:Uncharacterized protein n=1 Tax=Entamoeba invadens IP1 TaxID=370355 RepID=A0A0A1UFK2_ENTIV|nr:hypothetical protein EIN_142000 [Entamoeba invadens IP1]ELP95308.1 hypothetical protein EIN_142000 [Entamoeba invadens IP1]|eukprot:XP_004262079.1 hypothetical protein EIN_142000 [Entamoeba invadens IP1]
MSHSSTSSTCDQDNKEKNAKLKRDSTDSKYFYIHSCLSYLAMKKKYSFIILNKKRTSQKMAARFEIANIFDKQGKIVYDSNERYYVENSNIVFDSKGFPIKKSSLINTSERVTISESKGIEEMNNTDKLLFLMNFMNYKIKTFFPSKNQSERRTRTAKDPNKLSSVRLLLIPSYNIEKSDFELKMRCETEADDGECGLHFFSKSFNTMKFKSKTRKSDTAIFLGDIPMKYNKQYSNIKHVTLEDYEKEIISYKMNKGVTTTITESTVDNVVNNEDKSMVCDDEDEDKEKEEEIDENISVEIKQEITSQINSSPSLQSTSTDITNGIATLPVYYVPVAISYVNNTPYAIPLFDMNYFNTIQPCYFNMNQLSPNDVGEYSTNAFNNTQNVAEVEN